MKVKSMLFKGDSNIGLHTYVTNEYALVGMELSKDDMKELEKVFEVPVHKITIGGTSLLGVFLAGNSKNLLVPNIVFDSEIKALEKLKIPFTVFKTELTCLGNNIIAGENVAVVHIDFNKKEMNKIQEALDLERVIPMTLADVETVGSCVVMNDNGGLVHRFASSEEVEELNSLFNLKFGIGTVNMGSPLLRSGVACNNKGFIVGKHSGGPEMVNIDDNLSGRNE